MNKREEGHREKERGREGGREGEGEEISIVSMEHVTMVVILRSFHLKSPIFRIGVSSRVLCFICGLANSVRVSGLLPCKLAAV